MSTEMKSEMQEVNGVLPPAGAQPQGTVEHVGGSYPGSQGREDAESGAAAAATTTTTATAAEMEATQNGVSSEQRKDEQQTDTLQEDVISTPMRNSASAGNAVCVSPRKQTKISWKCGMCGYHVLAMDHEGKPLPLSVSSFGQVLPMSCPRCLLEHTSWEQAVPFDEHGDHANIRSKLSNNYVRTSSHVDTEARVFQPAPTSAAPGSHADGVTLPPILQEIGRRTYKEGVAQPIAVEAPRPRGSRMAYYCSKCGRKLLRMDPYGELVPMVRDNSGVPLPIVCPGCKIEHNQWDVKPFTITR
ncbi:hypothetical protein DQ04_00901120 [Trypanosoma grayi]|uniref:hypothetical protein n=1 Tax=Trypanosoma grayi TaxID=71804 RepID=UPI0004F474CA|nr:hypothetical protein DQ04_00901120 [Trypanosoma grayi]KEG13610.1 hypothetical protein DQ04_00901120 [Trypanosoma grayi]